MATVNTTLPPSRRSSKRALAIRMMVAETAWLDGQPRWEGGRVAWAHEGRLVVPSAGELALAQRRLYKIRRYPISAELALGDAAAWDARRRERLALAKRLRAIEAPDLGALAQRARDRQAGAAQRLAELLIAEALCLNDLPISPAAALLACAEHAQAPLLALLADDSAPLAARTLAALTLGALGMQNVELRIENGFASLHSQFSILNSQFPRLGRAYSYGLRFGLTATPALTAALLADEDGLALARRCERSLLAGGALALEPELLRELLAQDAAPARVVALADAAAAAEPLAQRILRHRDELPERPARHRRAVAEELLRRRRQILAGIADLLRSYARATADPEVIRLFASFTGLMVELGRLDEPLADAIALVLRHVLELPADLRRPALELLVELHGRLWDRATIATDKKVSNLSAWLQLRWARQVKPLLALLHATGDPEIAREAAALGIQYLLFNRDWPEPGMYRLALALVRENELASERYTVESLFACLGLFAGTGEAHAAFLPLSQALTPLNPQMREHFLDVVLTVVPHTREALKILLPQLARFLPRFTSFDKDDQSESCLCKPLLSCAVGLYTDRPGQADAWLDRLLANLAANGRNRSNEETDAIANGLDLALALNNGDFAEFQAILTAARQHSFAEDHEAMRFGLAMLRRFPALRDTLARLFPQQPRRCVQLIVRLGQAVNLGADALAPLEDLKAEPNIENQLWHSGSWFSVLGSRSCLAEDWRELLDLAPDLAPIAAAYQYAQWLLGGSQDVPAGVRRALDQPRKLAGELAYLDRALAERPERGELALRAANLRAYLADQERLARDLLAEARERLLQANAQALLAAAEAQVLACFRTRLEHAAGPLPAGLRLDEDLLNAVLLTVDITQNRRLLARLLRAHLAGEHDWRERHPANATFLGSLTARGIDTAAWLGEYPRTYRCDGITGGRVRLHLEREPLRILQMGNYMQTCLSVGGVNAFSTVANACELNKRVLYATDGAGHVVARKLIAISADGGLLGFTTYTTLGEQESASLRAIVQRYLRGFAARCGLALADDGRVPTLFAEAWYDDGCAAWDEEPPGSKPAAALGSGRHSELSDHSHAESCESPRRAQAHGGT